MSDIRRRRKSNQSCGSDDLSDSYEELNATKETQSSEQTDGHQDSECEIYASDSDVESHAESHADSHVDSQDGAQRESGDGQEEEKPQKKLDDDEDRRNPQYIPKRGTFYEHDDRTADEVEDNTAEVPNERETKEKKVWKDKEDRWDHDRYNDEEQAPKSHEELIAVYGYDIRNEEGPPRARRRRRYGRGPNKYTRNWEDENAYGKTGSNTPSGRNTSGRKFNRGPEDFPALGTDKSISAPSDEPVISSAWYSSKNKAQSQAKNFPPLQAQSDSPKTKSSAALNTHTNENRAPNEPSNPAWKKDGKHAPHNQTSNINNVAGGDAEKLVANKTSHRDGNKRNVQESVSLAASKTRGRGFKSNANNNMVANRAVETKPKGRGSGPITAENRRSNNVQNDDDPQLSHDTKNISTNDGTHYNQGGRHNKNFQSPNQQRSNTVPPRMQQQSQAQQQQTSPQQQQQGIQQQDGSGNRPKRYSSLRQRPTISDSPNQQNYPAQHGQHSPHNQHNQHGQHGYFPPQAGNSRSVLESQGYPQGHFEQTPPVGAAATPLAGQPVIPLQPGAQAASYAPPPFLVPPPQFIPPQTAPPSIINYVPGPNGPTFQPNFQGYQGYSPPVPPQRPPPPQELFQPQGCTYYSPAQQQQQQQQSAPIRRPKAAIPILPPPDNQQQQGSRGRGRSTQQPQQTNQPGTTALPEQEMKQESIEGEDRTIPEQFENLEAEPELAVDELLPENEDASVITNVVVKTEEIDVPQNSVVDVAVNECEINPIEQVDEMSADDSSKTAIEDQNTISLKSLQIDDVKTENELHKNESATSERTVVEEAAA